jgi:hypothetical protein
MDKLLCEDCAWHGLQSEMLTAPNPFDATDTIHGCPKCKSVQSLLVACDEPGCWRETSCGTPTPSGYRRTCGQHAPRG